ncbi:MAG: hypothetical protein HYY06_26270 [Deltaproteobacteria bacterium]|nr:hypothetical protein [Deltaproteobacteria bacterium]
MTRFRIAGLVREERIAPGAWDWERVRDRLVARCGELALGWCLTAQRIGSGRRGSAGGAVVIIRVAPEEPNIEAWGELYTCAEPLAQALSEALETEVVVVAFAVDDDCGALARFDRGEAVEARARVTDPLTLAARAVGIDGPALRELIEGRGGRDDSGTGDAPGAEEEPEIDGEEFAEQAWLEHKRREAQAWMARYRQLKSKGNGNENPQP